MDLRDELINRVSNAPLKDQIPPSMVTKIEELRTKYPIYEAAKHIGEFFPETLPAMNGHVPDDEPSSRVAQFVHDVLLYYDHCGQTKIAEYIPIFMPVPSNYEVCKRFVEHMQSHSLHLDMTFEQAIAATFDDSEYIIRRFKYNQEIKEAIELALKLFPVDSEFSLFDFYMRMPPLFCRRFTW